MKLNHDLIRELLISIEDMSDGHLNFDPSDLKNRYNLDYDLRSIEYHIKQLAQGGLIEAHNGYIIDLTFEGHQYLSNIRSSKVWSKTKETIKPMGNVAINVITEVAKKIALSELHL